MHHQSINKGQQTVYIIHGGPAVSGIKEKLLFPGSNQMIEDRKIGMGCIPFISPNRIQ